MTAPIAVRDVAAAAGALLVLSTVVSVVGTVIVPRKSGSRLTRLVASAVKRICRPGSLVRAAPTPGGADAPAAPKARRAVSLIRSRTRAVS